MAPESDAPSSRYRILPHLDTGYEEQAQAADDVAVTRRRQPPRRMQPLWTMLQAPFPLPVSTLRRRGAEPMRRLRSSAPELPQVPAHRVGECDARDLRILFRPDPRARDRRRKPLKLRLSPSLRMALEPGGRVLFTAGMRLHF